MWVSHFHPKPFLVIFMNSAVIPRENDGIIRNEDIHKVKYFKHGFVIYKKNRWRQGCERLNNARKVCNMVCAEFTLNCLDRAILVNLSPFSVSFLSNCILSVGMNSWMDVTCVSYTALWCGLSKMDLQNNYACEFYVTFTRLPQNHTNPKTASKI